MEELFVMESELQAFKNRHPEYNNFEPVYNQYGDLAGYVASVVEED
jgi:hypothetical protein